MEPATALLDAAYSELDLAGGRLLSATNTPSDSHLDDWTNSGGWLSLAKTVGADRVFFVNGNPVIVFVDGSKARSWHEVFNRAWCMGRPPLLFLAQPGSLAVYDLHQGPVRDEDVAAARDTRLLAAVTCAKDVQKDLQQFHRARLETGASFSTCSDRASARADQALINDLRKVRAALLDTGLSIARTDSLIGRSIFIRYLEDRRILTEDYYRRVAKRNSSWHALLDNAPTSKVGDQRRPFYTSVLQDRSFTIALFRSLASDFNGDLFPMDRREARQLTDARLSLVRRLLTGEAEGELLYFFAYDFEVVPIDLISSIYEEFLKLERGKQGTQGSFYTPSALVEFVLSSTLDADTLKRRPRIVDPACGSGIFLVEAFQRLVRYRMQEVGRRLRVAELKKILRDQIAGIDVNPEAVRVAAFSLYLALLNFLDPPDILGHRLPALTWSRAATPSPDRFDILLSSNAFGVGSIRADESVKLRFGEACADVVVGNPPWGKPPAADERGTEEAAVAMDWCSKRGLPVGDKELSQAFVHRAVHMLRPNGKAGLLVSTGVFLKRMTQSRAFRGCWLGECALSEVVNFAAVRHVYFTGRGRSLGAIAPFASVVFEKREWDRSHRIRYFSAKETVFVAGLQAVLLAQPDMHMVLQQALLSDDDLWKVYWWGNHRDAALISNLKAEPSLLQLIDPAGNHPERIGSGFKVSLARHHRAKKLKSFRVLPTDRLARYGPVLSDWLEPAPAMVERERDPEIYSGCRLLVRRGIEEKDGADGRIVARLASTPLAFRHSVYGIRFPDDLIGSAPLILGIMWSSLTRYFAWMTSGSWGMWHHELLKETLVRLPMRTTATTKVRGRIESIVSKLQSGSPYTGQLFSRADSEHEAGEVRALEDQLDDAVFDLFELNDMERDLIRDMCDVGLDLFYNGVASQAVKPVSKHLEEVAQYARAFLDVWRRLVPSGEQFEWELVSDASGMMLALVFRVLDSEGDGGRGTNAPEWRDVLGRYREASLHHAGTRSLYIDSMARIVNEHDIVIIKRNERRLWTRSAAREDADATVLQVLHRQQVLSEREACRA